MKKHHLDASASIPGDSITRESGEAPLVIEVRREPVDVVINLSSSSFLAQGVEEVSSNLVTSDQAV